MTLSAIDVGELIREQMTQALEPASTKSIPKSIPKAKAKETEFIFTYTKEEQKIREHAGKAAAHNFHKGLIQETINFCNSNKNMQILKSPNIVNGLRESDFWWELGKEAGYANKEHRFYNSTMASIIWKFKGKWIISSYSAYINNINKV